MTDLARGVEIRKLPPIPLLGFTNATFGMFAGFSVVSMPEMLAAQGIPGGRIAAITAAVLSPGFLMFLLAPVLDVWLSRRTYALLFSVFGALGLGWTVAHRTDVFAVEAAMFIGYVAVCFVQAAVGGWMGSLVRKEDDSRLGAWFTISNLSSGGIMILVSGEVIRMLPAAAAGALLGAAVMLPSLLYLFIPAPGPDRRLARESFGQFFGELRLLIARREVLVALLLFALPSASFTLTNVLGGIGRDFHASQRMVSLLGGAGAAVAGVVGSLLLPPLAKRFPLRPLYLGIGVVGALFTFSLLLLPRTSATFAVAMVGENSFQALAFAAAFAITFEVIGPANPLAATTFSLLVAATNLPIIYMGFVDGRAYGRRGFSGSILADAGISAAVCIVLALLLPRLSKSPA